VFSTPLISFPNPQVDLPQLLQAAFGNRECPVARSGSGGIVQADNSPIAGEAKIALDPIRAKFPR
jgi:hypothetical protein